MTLSPAGKAQAASHRVAFDDGACHGAAGDGRRTPRAPVRRRGCGRRGVRDCKAAVGRTLHGGGGLAVHAVRVLARGGGRRARPGRSGRSSSSPRPGLRPGSPATTPRASTAPSPFAHLHVPRRQPPLRRRASPSSPTPRAATPSVTVDSHSARGVPFLVRNIEQAVIDAVFPSIAERSPNHPQTTDMSFTLQHRVVARTHASEGAARAGRELPLETSSHTTRACTRCCRVGLAKPSACVEIDFLSTKKRVFNRKVFCSRFFGAATPQSP